MSSCNLRRVMNESKQLENNKYIDNNLFIVSKVDDSMYHWQATIYGPKDSLYYGYGFLIDILLPNDYPNSPIGIKFITPIEHVNVNKKGDLCMDILKTTWSSALSIRTVLVSTVSLL